MPATLTAAPDMPRPAIAATASPYGLALRDDRRTPAKARNGV